MPKRSSRTLVAAVAVAAIVAIPTGAHASAGSSDRGDRGRDGLQAVGLSDEGKALVRFDTDAPKKAKRVGHLRGLEDDTRLVGIDYRVQNGKLYGVGDKGGIYLVDDHRAHAERVGQLSEGLEGEAFGVDFNPAANALRVVSDQGQNLRQPFGEADEPNGETVVDGALNTAGEPATGVTGAAYTNNDLDPATATTLFDLDTAMDQVTLQSPANSGSLAATGALGVDAGTDAGFDIYSTVRDGRTVDVEGYATLGQGRHVELYEVSLLTGAAESKGRLPFPVTDLAVKLEQR